MSAQPNQTHFGTIKAFNEEKGWGHIGCDATHNHFQKDVFFMKSSFVDRTVTSIQAGVWVSFKASMQSRGPQATEVTELPQGCIGVEGQPGRLYHGTVKSWNEAKGFGFLEGEELRHLFGKDVFLHKRELEEGAAPQPGETVSFSVELDKSGHPKAKTVSRGTSY